MKLGDKLRELARRLIGSPAVVTATLSPPRPAEPLHDLYLGLDLGTSCSKAVVRDAQTQHAWVVPLSESEDGLDACLNPTRVFELDGTFGLNRVEGALFHTDLKLGLLDAVENVNRDRPGAESRFTAYTALLLRKVLCWFEKERSRDYQGRRVCWWLNVGIPQANDSDTVLRQAYRRCLAAACPLASETSPLTMERVKQACAVNSNEVSNIMEGFSAARLEFYPELAAQLAGYALSPHARRGPLLLMDVGAGTLDVATLILHEREHAQFCSFHFRRVERLGAWRLFLARLEAIKMAGANETTLNILLRYEPSQPSPNSFEDFLPAGNQHFREVFRGTSESFAQDCLSCAHDTVRRFRLRLRAAHETAGFDPFAHKDGNYLPTAMTGGGARLDFYRTNLLTRLEEKLVPYTQWNESAHERNRHKQGLKPVPFPVPDGLNAPMSKTVLQANFDRFSVADGLARPKDDLMRLTDNDEQ